MKKYPLILTFMFASLLLQAQTDTTYWQKSLSGGINFNQTSFSNWSGGGINSVAFGGLLGARALYTKGNLSWDNTADLQLGYVKQGGVNRKATDQIFLNSVLGRKIAPKWDLFASATFNTFFARGFVYDADKIPTNTSQFLISRFLAPGQLSIAWGVAYKPNDWFSLRVSPFAPKFTFLNDQSVRHRIVNGRYVADPSATTFGVEAGKSVRTEWLALQIQAALNRNLSENVNLKVNYLGFANYKTLAADGMDHRLEAVIAAKVSKYISTTFGVIALYDKDYSANWQTQQALTIGLLYNVSTFRKK